MPARPNDMKICILSDAYEQSRSPMRPYDLPCDPSRYLEGHECRRVFLRKTTAVQELIQLAQEKFDVFVNLCDGAWDEDRPGIEVVQALQRLGQAFTGADTSFYEPSREAMKRVCHYWEVGTPGYVVACDPGGVQRAARMLRFPLIVKHPSSYSSIGLTPASRVKNAEELARQAEIMISAFGAALVEEFIDGREFTVLVAENPDDPARPVAYRPVEFRFPSGESFKHFEMKWMNYHEMDCVPCPEGDLSERLKEMSRRLFTGLNGVSYGRCDIRMDQRGQLYMLEINPNCGIFYPSEDAGSADFVLLNDPAGHRGFLDLILRAALKRQRERRRKWQVRWTPDRGYATFSSGPLATGEVICPGEEKAAYLVSRGHVQRTWDEKRRGWFERYAYPLSDEIWGMWSPDPEEWRPLNHSCDPNSWLEGLDLVARRDIAADEEITVDYATFCVETMPDFQCQCQTPCCRGVVRGTDHLQPFVTGYGEHVSDYVLTRRRQAAP